MSFLVAGAIAGGASALGGIGGAIISGNAAKDAAALQAQASHEANQLQSRMWDEQKQMYQQARDQSRADFEPWRQSGVGALGEMGSQDFRRDFGANDFVQDPGYAFRMAEGQKALERSAAARGGLQSGGLMKSLARYGQEFASGEYQNAYSRFNADRDRRFGRLSNIAGMGQASAAGMANASGNYAQQMGAAGQNYAGNVGNNLMGAANAQGAAGIAGANAWSGALSGIGQAGMGVAAMGQQKSWMDKWLASQGGGA